MTAATRCVALHRVKSDQVDAPTFSDPSPLLARYICSGADVARQTKSMGPVRKVSDYAGMVDKHTSPYRRGNRLVGLVVNTLKLLGRCLQGLLLVRWRFRRSGFAGWTCRLGLRRLCGVAWD